MPTTIKTEQARVALAHREYEQERTEIEAQVAARIQVLRDDPRATDLAAFKRLCIADGDLQRLALELAAIEVWRDGVIADGCIATIEDDGRVRWTLPKYAHKPDRGHA